MTQPPYRYGHRPPYQDEWAPREETTPNGYPPPYIRPVDGPGDHAGPRGMVYGSAPSPYPQPSGSGLADARPSKAAGRGSRARLVAGVAMLLIAGAGGVAAYVWKHGGSPNASYLAGSSGTTVSPDPQGVAGGSGTAGASRGATGSSVGPNDPGLALCRQIRDYNGQPSSFPVPGGGTGSGDAAFQYMRKQFADSQYADIREAGTNFVDKMRVMPTPTGTDIAAIVKQLYLAMKAAYDPLIAACANHGVKLPPITVNGTSVQPP